MAASMAGHNKWSKVKHKKAAQDAKKSREFSKLARLITVEAQRCGGDTDSPALRALIDKARAANMPKENIMRAVSRGAGKDDAALQSLTYEMYGPGGVAMLIEVLTDNPNRSHQEVKHAVSKRGFELAAPGSAQWAFSKEGDAWTPSTTVSLSEEETAALEELREALEELEDVQEVITNAA